MGELRGACLVAQSGGPTAVINSSVLGVIEGALAAPAITKVLGAVCGIRGVLAEDLFDLGKEDPAELALLTQTPAAILGSCRYRLGDKPGDFEKILSVFQKHDIRYFFYNGGNDSMDTCHKIARYMDQVGYECRIIGVPKTIDNDLALTDHCPGFGSAARYIATACMELRRDVQVYAMGSVLVLEVMGRHAGWLTGASALAGLTGNGPDLIYLPEIPFDADRFLGDVDDVCRRSNGQCLAVVSEGIHDAKGGFFTACGPMSGDKDCFGHTQLGGVSTYLAGLVRDRLGIKKVRGVEPSLLQRCAAHTASGRDVDEARMAGLAAVEAALAGETGKMVSFACERRPQYICRPQLVPLDQVANAEKTVPLDWIDPKGNYVTRDFLDYAAPLIQGDLDLVLSQGLPRYARLKFFPLED